MGFSDQQPLTQMGNPALKISPYYHEAAVDFDTEELSPAEQSESHTRQPHPIWAGPFWEMDDFLHNKILICVFSVLFCASESLLM